MFGCGMAVWRDGLRVHKRLQHVCSVALQRWLRRALGNVWGRWRRHCVCGREERMLAEQRQLQGSVDCQQALLAAAAADMARVVAELDALQGDVACMHSTRVRDLEEEVSVLLLQLQDALAGAATCETLAESMIGVAHHVEGKLRAAHQHLARNQLAQTTHQMASKVTLRRQAGEVLSDITASAVVLTAVHTNLTSEAAASMKAREAERVQSAAERAGARAVLSGICALEDLVQRHELVLLQAQLGLRLFSPPPHPATHASSLSSAPAVAGRCEREAMAEVPAPSTATHADGAQQVPSPRAAQPAPASSPSMRGVLEPMFATPLRVSVGHQYPASASPSVSPSPPRPLGTSFGSGGLMPGVAHTVGAAADVSAFSRVADVSGRTDSSTTHVAHSGKSDRPASLKAPPSLGASSPGHPGGEEHLLSPASQRRQVRQLQEALSYQTQLLRTQEGVNKKLQQRILRLEGMRVAAWGAPQPRAASTSSPAASPAEARVGLLEKYRDQVCARARVRRGAVVRLAVSCLAGPGNILSLTVPLPPWPIVSSTNRKLEEEIVQYQSENDRLSEEKVQLLRETHSLKGRLSIMQVVSATSRAAAGSPVATVGDPGSTRASTSPNALMRPALSPTGDDHLDHQADAARLDRSCMSPNSSSDQAHRQGHSRRSQRQQRHDLAAIRERPAPQVTEEASGPVAEQQTRGVTHGQRSHGTPRLERLGMLVLHRYIRVRSLVCVSVCVCIQIICVHTQHTRRRSHGQPVAGSASV